MALFNKPKAGGFMDEIRCDEPSYLIWKWHPVGSEKGNNNRENAIRWGSSLRVKDGEVAVFVYKQENGTMQDFIVGPFDQTIKTANLPVLASLVGLAFEGGTPFQAEVYFINLAHIIQVKFGVPFFDVYDPRFLDFGVPTAVRGTISFKISDYQEFIKLHKKVGMSIAVNLGLITGLNLLLKQIVQRPRPIEYRIIDEVGYSFPSGHSMVSMAFYGFIIYLIYRYVTNKHLKWSAIAVLSILIIAIGVSRIYLGVHYTSDVLAGFLISISYLIIYVSAVDKFVLKEETK